ncbi:MAG: hypothetical protein IK099_13440 [Clostridia bacterium]|nr:hypothetical protein [Clostridia bacterium]
MGLALSKSYREGGLLKQETARRMLTPVMDNYGLCVYNLRGDIGCHSGWNEGFLTEWFFSLREGLCVASMLNRTAQALGWDHGKAALALFQTAEEDMAEDPDKTGWAAYCGQYEQLAPALRLIEVYMEDGALYARIMGQDEAFSSKLYPIGEKAFGRKGGFEKIIFGEGCLTINGIACKKL